MTEPAEPTTWLQTPESATLGAPTFRGPADGSPETAGVHGTLLGPGERIDDYEIIRVLGTGSFARVYLARQISLERTIALKVSADLGNEARTMASLEHAHIVQVFSETVIAERGIRLLCMQFVPGVTLERVIATLNDRNRRSLNGQKILDVIDRLSTEPAPLDPAALQDRETLKHCDFIEATCWLGARLGEALAYAHERGVLHRDIKPANILLNPYGRPFLADFNIAVSARRNADGEVFGGTLSYMAPEHLRAFHSVDPAILDAVDHRADIYGLGVVLFELVTGKRPFRHTVEGSDTRVATETLVAEREGDVPSARDCHRDIPTSLDTVLKRCMAPDPAMRYASGAEVAQALEGCRQLQRIQRDLPTPGAITHFSWQHPIFALVLFSLLPHFFGSAVNIAYNSLCIVEDLTAEQQKWFVRLVVLYNVLVYPLCVWLLYRLIVPVYRAFRMIESSQPASDEVIAKARRRALTLPIWATALSCAGWLPGGIVFPAGISLLAGAVPLVDVGHFVVSFTVSGLIAMTYSFFGVEYVVLRALYPRLWTDARTLRDSVSDELRGHDRRMRIFQLLAGLIPIVGAALLVCSGPEQLTFSFRLLVTALLALGLAGFGLAVFVSSELNRVLATIASAARR